MSYDWVQRRHDLATDGAFAQTARLTKVSRGRIIARTSFGVDAQFTTSVPSGGDCIYVLHSQHMNCKSGNSGAAATLLLPNNVVTHAVHSGIIAGSKAVAAALEGVAPHVRLIKRNEQDTQAIVRLLEGVTQQRHSALCDFWKGPKVESSQLEVEG